MLSAQFIYERWWQKLRPRQAGRRRDQVVPFEFCSVFSVYIENLFTYDAVIGAPPAVTLAPGQAARTCAHPRTVQQVPRKIIIWIYRGYLT